MIPRAAAAAIVVFWLVMTALLVRLEVAPAESDLLRVPPAHVAKLMFLHGQESDLQIVHAGQRIGSFAARPQRRESGENVVAFNGNIALRGPDGQRQRVSWNGSLDLAADLTAETLALSATTTEPAYSLDAQIDFPARRASYLVTLGGAVVEQSEITLDEAGMRALLDRIGIDEQMLAGASARVTAPSITARRSTFKLRSDEVEAYRVAVSQGEITLVEVWVSQLGQVLVARTGFGYSLAADEISSYTGAP